MIKKIIRKLGVFQIVAGWWRRQPGRSSDHMKHGKATIWNAPRKLYVFLLFIAFTFPPALKAQKINEPELINSSSQFNSSRFTTVVISETALASIVTIGLQYLWYKKYPKSRFHFFNDNNEWLQMDKVGHATSAYNIAAVQYNLMRWSGVRTNSSIWIAGATALAYM